jgi:hypothetical protein
LVAVVAHHLGLQAKRVFLEEVVAEVLDMTEHKAPLQRLEDLAQLAKAIMAALAEEHQVTLVLVEAEVALVLLAAMELQVRLATVVLARQVLFLALQLLMLAAAVVVVTGQEMEAAALAEVDLLVRLDLQTLVVAVAPEQVAAVLVDLVDLEL